MSAISPNRSTEFATWSHAIIESVDYTCLDIQLQQPAPKQGHGDLRIVAAFDFMYSMYKFGLKFPKRRHFFVAGLSRQSKRS